MMRTVVTFEPYGSQTMVKLDVAPGIVDGLGNNLPVDLTGLPEGTLVERGEGLVALLNKHEPVRAGLTAALAVPPGSDPAPLYFHVRTASADAVPWEQIYAAPHGFCALDRRWPVGRIAHRSQRLTVRAYTPPLRIVAVLSAAGRDGIPQLQALLAALESADAAAIGVSLQVISGDERVLDEAARRGATVAMIEPSAPGLGRQIAAARPHILHVLCHGGGAAAGVRTLAFAHYADFDAYPPAGAWPAAGPADSPDAAGSVRLSVAELLGALLPCNPWLVVLGACETAQARGKQDGQAAAHELVSGGIPAVVGMRRLVDLTDTDRFCAALYPEVLALVRQAVAPGVPAGQPPVCTLDWAAALTGPRVVMGGLDPAAIDSWTDPVLYAQDDLLQVLVSSPQLSPADFAALLGRLDQFRGVLGRLDPATTHPDMIGEVRARVAELEAALAQAGG